MDETFSRIAPSGGRPPPPPPTSVAGGNAVENAVNAKSPRYDWTKDEIREIYETPLMELAFHSVSAGTE